MWWMVAASFCGSVIVMPLIIILCRHFGWYDVVDERKIHKGNIPRLGGAGILSSFAASSLIYFIVTPTAPVTHVLPLIIAGLIIFAFGLLDDFLDLRALYKLFFQIIAALIVICNNYRFKQICGWELPLWFSYVLTFCWIIGIINAFNLIDGMDGLCGGISFLILGALGIIFIRSARPTSAICFILAAAVAGFLVFNMPPAKIFMGDGGSQVIGFMIAALPLYYSTPNFEYNKFLVILVLVSIPLLDTISAIWRRTREHRSFFSPDSRHIHHKLLQLGCSREQALFILLILQIILCCAAGLGMYLKDFHGSILLIVTFVFMIAFYSTLHFVFTIAQKNNMIKEIKKEA
jgi:UDP-GlcNAc:undecaprenyl-phosphate GlcNAc-1-phosphate transferase